MRNKTCDKYNICFQLWDIHQNISPKYGLLNDSLAENQKLINKSSGVI